LVTLLTALTKMTAFLNIFYICLFTSFLAIFLTLLEDKKFMDNLVKLVKNQPLL